MDVLLLGSGAREHALGWRLAQSPSVGRLFAAPGNPGIAAHAELVPLDPCDGAAVTAWALDRGIGLVVIGPEQPLVAGVADALREGGVPVFGPSAAAARLEGSKGFTRDLTSWAGVPGAAYARFTDRMAAEAALIGFGLPVVVKADGLAAGKGVVIAETHAEAKAALADMFGGGFGDAGAAVVLEEFLVGEEASFFALTDGAAVVPFGSAQDHKRVGEGDTGPNTGGMGAYSPAPCLTPALEEEVLARIVRPTVRALAEAGTPYSGVLYAGLMLTAEGPKLIEYNARFGDPEAQVLMMRYEGDLAALLLAVAEGRLAEAGPVALADAAAVTVVLAADGYPGTPAAGGAIGGIPAAEAGGARVFQAGTRDEGGRLVASGGRVLSVTASGATIRAAHDAAYRGVDAIDFPTGFCRRDIGWRALGREDPQ